MITRRASGNPEHVLRVTARSGVLLIPLVFLTLLAFGHVAWGLAAGIGLFLGVSNTLMADRLFSTGVPFLVTSGLRIVVLSAAALVALVVFKPSIGIAFVLGVAAAQVLLSIVAAVEAARGGAPS